MTDPPSQITVLDAGGQYCHLIARKVRELGVYADVKPSDTPAAILTGKKGIIISGGPSSVYEAGSPTVDPDILDGRQPVLGICYGQQLLAHLLGGSVRKGEKGEYGAAVLEIRDSGTILDGVASGGQVWMSHRDTVSQPPPGFRVLGRTSTCEIAAIADDGTGRFGLQFHPEVVHTHQGTRILENFLFSVCRCTKDWDASGRVAAVEEEVRRVAGSRNVFFFVSGGVDSTVAYTLAVRALGPEKVHGVYVDTGLMREGETDYVRGIFDSIGASHFRVEDASTHFLTALAHVRDPEQKRHIIGEMFVRVQERILETGHYLDGHWILGQGTIYPDTIESGGTAKAEVIKTHHNRVPGIQRLVEANRIVEPLTSFYKDEVRAVGRELGLPTPFLERHPFPGPGLAIRCLCSDISARPEETADGWILQVSSVGVQGDSRSYRPVLAVEELDREMATQLVNRLSTINRVIAVAGTHVSVGELSVRQCSLTPNRLDTLRRADAVVRRFSKCHGFEAKVWQFPVVLIPVGTPKRPDSVVLRPIYSVDGMTADPVLMDPALLSELTRELLALGTIAAVFYDLTSKPPATIEWE